MSSPVGADSRSGSIHRYPFEGGSTVISIGDTAFSVGPEGRLERDRRRSADQLRPNTYGPWRRLEGAAKAANLTAALKAYHIHTTQIRSVEVEGRPASRRGIIREELVRGVAGRDRTVGSDPSQSGSMSVLN